MSSLSNNQTKSVTAVPDLTSFTPLLLPTFIAPQATATLPINNTNNRFNCTHPNCSASFNRIGDLRRHDRVHGVPAHPCTVSGCSRKGGNAFYRRDKLLDHMRKKHGMTV
ncbi:hypothetical protein BDZ45DRAFT_580895 [Acephala macrosclerotiorum]|nr:hypothetical protein BDZ45DRAFT_580895 [Acephala macrosclerotiorum]